MENSMPSRAYPINPLATISQSPYTVATLARVCIWASAIVTSYGFYLLVSSKLREVGAPLWVEVSLSLAAAVVSAKVTDFGFISICEYVLFYAFGLPIRAWSPHPQYGVYYRYWLRGWYRHIVLHSLTWLLFVGIAAAMFYADRIAAKMASVQIEGAAPQRARTDLASMRSGLTQQSSAAVAPIQNQITAAEKAARAAEISVEKDNAALAALAASGNGWARKKIAEKKEQKSRKYRKSTENLQTELSKISAKNADQSARMMESAIADDEIVAERNRTIAAMSGNTAYIFGWWMKVVGVIAYVILIVMMFARGENLDVNGDGKIDLSDLHAFSGTKPRTFFNFFG